MAKYPRIKHCLVCEDLRFEANRKAILLGFYGVMPNVSIKIQDFNLPMGQLTFVLFSESPKSGGSFKLEVNILDSKDNPIIPPQPGSTTIVPSKATESRLVFAFQMIHFKQPDDYYLNLKIDGKSHYKEKFHILEGEPSEFQI